MRPACGPSSARPRATHLEESEDEEVPHADGEHEVAAQVRALRVGEDGDQLEQPEGDHERAEKLRQGQRLLAVERARAQVAVEAHHGDVARKREGLSGRDEVTDAHGEQVALREKRAGLDVVRRAHRDEGM